MKHAMEMKTCTKINFLFVFNLVWIRIRKISLFWLNNYFDDAVKAIYKRISLIF